MSLEPEDMVPKYMAYFTEPVPFGEGGREYEEMGIKEYADKGEELKILTTAMDTITVKKDIVVKIEHITDRREMDIEGV